MICAELTAAQTKPPRTKITELLTSVERIRMSHQCNRSWR
jgi:hypothetical protein